MKEHSLFTSLKELDGNARGCVYTEPMWGITYNLYAPYVSVFMIAIGLSDKQIGALLSIGLIFQTLFALLSGVITDKIGRRLTTLIFDLLSWSVPALISALAQNYWYFLAAAIFNSSWRVTHNSWTCLLVEDTDPRQLVDIYSWVYISGLLVAFFAPIAGILIKSFSLVPAMRGLYLFAAVMFAVKCLITYRLTRETTQGKVRMQATRHQSAFTVLRGYKQVFRDLLRSPQTLYTAGIMLIFSICSMISGTFWAILVTEKLKIPSQDLAYFPFLKSVFMLVFFFAFIPRMRSLHFKIPMTAGFIGFVVSQLLLIAIPEKGYLLLGISVLLEACSLATVSPLVDQMTVRTVDPEERARIQSILYVGIIILTSPFGWIAGLLSQANKNLPFFVNIVLYAGGAIMAYIAGGVSLKHEAAAMEAETSPS